MAIRFIMSEFLEVDGDIGLMSLKDIWIQGGKKQGMKYAHLVLYLEQKGFSPIAIDDKQVPYYLCRFEASGRKKWVNVLDGQKYIRELFRESFKSEEQAGAPQDEFGTSGPGVLGRLSRFLGK